MVKYSLWFGNESSYSFVKLYDTFSEADAARVSLKDAAVSVIEVELKANIPHTPDPDINEACVAFTSKFKREMWQEICLSNDAFVAGWKSALQFIKTKR